MHCAALTHDNKILTWGVNDQGALGRETTQEGKMKDITNGDDSDSDSDDDGEGLNPSEAEPRLVEPKHFPEGTKFAQLVASDSATFVVTNAGLVYGWGTFRVSISFPGIELYLTQIGQRWYFRLQERCLCSAHSSSYS